jgi:hypothetical protein
MTVAKKDFLFSGHYCFLEILRSERESFRVVGTILRILLTSCSFNGEHMQAMAGNLMQHSTNKFKSPFGRAATSKRPFFLSKDAIAYAPFLW